jgi:putative transposase
MREACADSGAELREFNGDADHVHLLVHYPPKVALSRLIGSLKGVSARRLRQEPRPMRCLPGPKAWGSSHHILNPRDQLGRLVIDRSGDTLD